MPDINPSLLTKSLRHTTNILLTSAFLSAPLIVNAQDDNIGFANDEVCAVPRIDLPKALLLSREKITDAKLAKLAEKAKLEAEADKDAEKGAGDENAEPMLSQANAPQEEQPEQPIELEGDTLNVEGGNKIVMKGNAHVIQGERGVFADSIIYDQDTYNATIDGNVRYYTVAGDEIITESMRLEIDTFIGDTDASKMRLASREPINKSWERNYVEDFTPFAPITNRVDEADTEEEVDARPRVGSRVTADSIEIEGVDFQRLHNATYTRCPTGDDVVIKGREIELDHETGLGTAKNVTVKFKGVPIFYAPRFSFPINDERKSGFLAPSIGDDDKSGTIISLPYYFNIAPQADATVRATHYTERGTQLFGEFRYLNAFGDASLKAEVLPGDDLFNGEDRDAITLDVRQRYSNGWGMSIDLQDVSDTSYLSDFRNDINLTSSTHLPQTLRLNYSGDLVYMRALTSKYTSVSPDLATSNPFDRLPQVEFGINRQEFGPLDFELDAEYITFEHDDNTRVTGSRLNVKPSISLPYEPVYGLLKPKLSFRSISYSLDNVAAGAEDSPSVAAPIFSVDSGIYLERESSWGDRPILHTLEPRAMFVYVPEENQDDLPDFDTGEGSVSSFGVLFREDRFFGGDRIGDDQHLALGLTTRVIDDDDGEELLKASIGQLYYFEDRQVGLNADAAADTVGESDIFAEFNAKFTKNFKVNSFLRWDTEEKEVSNFNVGLDYENGSRRSASLDYFRTGDTAEDVRLQLDWPLSPRVQLQADQRYSIANSESRASTVGLAYDGCCWAFGVKTTQLLQSNGNTRSSILFSLELDGLGTFQTSQ